MDLLVGRMERTDRHGIPPFLTMSSSDNIRPLGAIRPGNNTNNANSQLKSPLIAVNDIPLRPPAKRSPMPEKQAQAQGATGQSMVDLRGYFNIEGVDNEHAMESDSEDEEERATSHIAKGTLHPHPRSHAHHSHDNVLDYCAAGSGMFSDLEFTFHASPKSRSLAVSHSPSRLNNTQSQSQSQSRQSSMSDFSSMHRRSSLFLSTPSSMFLKNNRSMSSHFGSSGCNKKRLVNQFLRPSDMDNAAAMASVQQQQQLAQLQPPLLSDRTSSHSASSSLSGGKVGGPHLQNVLYRDLDASTSISDPPSLLANSHTLLKDFAPQSIASSRYPSSVDIQALRQDPNAAPQFRDVNYSGKQQQRTGDTVSEKEAAAVADATGPPAVNMSLYYDKHIQASLGNLQMRLRDTFQSSVIQEESKFDTLMQHFDSLAAEYTSVDTSVRALHDTLQTSFKTNVQDRFNEADPASLRCQLNSTIGTCVADLQSLEDRMHRCQDRLADQRETIRRLDNLLAVENSLLQLEQGTKTVHRYKYFVCDVLILAVAVAVLRLYVTLPFM